MIHTVYLDVGRETEDACEMRGKGRDGMIGDKEKARERGQDEEESWEKRREMEGG